MLHTVGRAELGYGMPPTHTDVGLVAVQRIRTEQPEALDHVRRLEPSLQPAGAFHHFRPSA
jgi:hypothetical protein